MKIEVDSLEYAKGLYDKYDVVLEETVLESNDIYYSICRVNSLDTYDVLLIDKNEDSIINFESRVKLSGSTLKYFNVYKDDVLRDIFGNEFKCITHHVLI